MQSTGEEDWLGGLSLDAVVRKAAELERVLSSCKARAVGDGEGEGGRGGERGLAARESWAAPAKEADFNAKYGGSNLQWIMQPQLHFQSQQSFLDSSLIMCMIVLSLHAWSRVPSTPSSPLCAMHNSVQSSQPREGEVAMAWQHLMAYIVALEKEVQHYKQLLEGASHQLEVASSTPNPPEDSSPAMMGHKQTAVEEVTTSSREQQATTWPQDMEHWDALFEGQCTRYSSQICSTHLRYESTKLKVVCKAVCDLVMQSSGTKDADS